MPPVPPAEDDEEARNSGTNLFVTGIHPRLSEDDVTRLFEKYGEVDKCNIMRDPHSRESRGFGFVNMMSGTEADAAKEGLQGEVYEGRTLSIEKARRSKPRTPTPGKYFGPPKRGMSALHVLGLAATHNFTDDFRTRGGPPRGGRGGYSDRYGGGYGGRRDDSYSSYRGGGRYDRDDRSYSRRDRYEDRPPRDDRYYGRRGGGGGGGRDYYDSRPPPPADSSRYAEPAGGAGYADDRGDDRYSRR